MPPVSSRTIKISKPDTISGFKLEASANCGYKIAGRKLPNRPNSERIPNKPFSGRIAISRPSHLGPPTAPSKIASQALALDKVSSGNGLPVASMALPPNKAESMFKSRPNLSLQASSTLTASLMISGPMPSPGITNTLCVMSLLPYLSTKQPRGLGLSFLFVTLNKIGLF